MRVSFVVMLLVSMNATAQKPVDPPQAPPGQGKGIIDQPLSYYKPTPSGRFLYAVVGDPEVEAKIFEGKKKEEFRLFREKFPKSGLYPADGGAPIWTIDDGIFTHHDYLYLGNDGDRVIRLEGDWWRTKAFSTTRKMLPSEEVERQLNQVGLRFFLKGKPVRSYTIRELVENPDALPQTPEHLLWTTGGILNESTGRFLLYTHDDRRIVFNAETGEILSREAVGLANPLARKLVMGFSGFSLLLLLLWARYAFLRERERRQTTA